MDIPHELRDEFPQEISLIERMIRTNYEFRRLAERYDEVNRNIYRIESGEEPTTDEVLARLKKWRLKFKDEIAAILTKLEHRRSSSPNSLGGQDSAGFLEICATFQRDNLRRHPLASGTRGDAPADVNRRRHVGRVVRPAVTWRGGILPRTSICPKTPPRGFRR